MNRGFLNISPYYSGGVFLWSVDFVELGQGGPCRLQLNWESICEPVRW